MKWKTVLCLYLMLGITKQLAAQCTPSGSPTCAANISTVQQLTDCLAAGGSPNITVDLADINCTYNLSGATINLADQVDIRFTGIVTVSSSTFFTSSTVNASITVGPLLITATSVGGGDLTFAQLNLALGILPGPITLNAALGILPVEFSSFSGKASGRGIRLDWSTATESNNKQFEVEFSEDGKSFKQIGVIAGAGTSYTPQQYNYEHTTPSTGINYYRLRQVDYDGTFEYSSMVTVEMKGKGFATYRIFPNPVQHTFTIQSEGGEAPSNVSLINTLGQEIRLQNTHPNSFFELPRNLQRGTYILRFEGAGETRFERILVQ